jgi:hypothetical protein
MVSVARTAVAEAESQKEAAQKAKEAVEAKEREQAKAKEIAVLIEREKAKEKELALDRIKLEVKQVSEVVVDTNVTESETEGDTEGSMTARTEGSLSSSDTQPPSVASDDESGMMSRLQALGIGQEAVGHVMWIAESSGLESASNRLSTRLGTGDSRDPKDPPVIDGLVPLRAGRVHWAGFVSTPNPESPLCAPSALTNNVLVKC